MQYKALLVSHDEHIAEEIEESLTAEECECDIAFTLVQARKRLKSNRYACLFVASCLPTQRRTDRPRIENAQTVLACAAEDCARMPAVVVGYGAGHKEHSEDDLFAVVMHGDGTPAGTAALDRANRVVKQVVSEVRTAAPGRSVCRPAPSDEAGDEDEDDARDLAADRDEGAGENENGRIALTEGQRDVLQAMAEKPNTVMHQADLAAAAGYSRSAVWRHIRKLERHGLVARHGDNSRGVVLTAEGEELAKAEAM